MAQPGIELEPAALEAIFNWIEFMMFQGASISEVMIFYNYDGQWYPEMVGPKFLMTFVLQLEKKPGEPSTRKSVPAGDRTRARYVGSIDVIPRPPF